MTALVVALVLLSARAADACSVCFGDPNAQMTRGAEQGVWFLLGVMVLVQIGFGIFFFHLRRRARGFRDPQPRPMFRLVKG
ncbi:MAG: hypothetical protein IT293_08220 [Deltaproteobacteria bacterium]|nr:hypothetical protein [Deltaproteobacteria bacterium]